MRDDTQGTEAAGVSVLMAGQVVPGANGPAQGTDIGTGPRPEWATDHDPSWEELLDRATGMSRDLRFAGRTDRQLEDDLAGSAAAIDAATCRWLELLAEFVVRGVWADQGARTPGVWLSWRLGIAASTAREHVRVALRLREFPRIRERFAAGTLSYSKVRALTRFGDPRFEELLLSWADDGTAAQLETIARGFRRAERARHDDAWDGPGEAGWSVRGRTDMDGTRTLTIRGPVEIVAAIEEGMHRLARQEVLDARDEADGGDDRGGEPPDTVGQATSQATSQVTSQATSQVTSQVTSQATGLATDQTTGPVQGRTTEPATDLVTGPAEGPATGQVAGHLTDEPMDERPATVTSADRVQALHHAVLAATAADTPPDTSGVDAHTLVISIEAEALLADTPADALLADTSADAQVADTSAVHRSLEQDRPVPLSCEAGDRPGEAGSGPEADVEPSGGAVLVDRESGGPPGSWLSGRTVPARDDHGRVRGMRFSALRQLACEAGIVAIAVDGPGSVVDVGRRSRRTSAPLRRALQRRDRACTFPGCTASRHLHAHHVVHWADGGPTDLDNLVLLCAHHHRFVHDRSWSIEVRRDGRHRFRADGSSSVVPHVGTLPGASAAAVPRAAPATADAEALRPPTYDGGRFDLDIAVAVLQQEHERVRRPLPVAA